MSGSALQGLSTRMCGAETEEPPERGESEAGGKETSSRDWVRFSVQIWGHRLGVLRWGCGLEN